MPGVTGDSVCSFGVWSSGVDGVASESASTGYGPYQKCHWSAEAHDILPAVYDYGEHSGNWCWSDWILQPGCEKQLIPGFGDDGAWRLPIVPGLAPAANVVQMRYGIPLTAVPGVRYDEGYGEPMAVTLRYSATCVTEASADASCPFSFTAVVTWERSGAAIGRNYWTLESSGFSNVHLLQSDSYANQPNVFYRPEGADSVKLSLFCNSGFCNGETWTGNGQEQRSFYSSVSLFLLLDGDELGWGIGGQPDSCTGLGGQFLAMCQGSEWNQGQCTTGDSIGGISGDVTKPYICPEPDAVCVSPTAALDVVGWLAYIACQVEKLPQILYNLLVVPALNFLIDLLYPGEAIGATLTGFSENIKTRQPFNVVAPLIDAVGQGLQTEGASPLGSFSFELQGNTVDVSGPLETALVTLVPYRDLIGAFIWLVVALKVIRLTLSMFDVNGGPTGEGA